MQLSHPFCLLIPLAQELHTVPILPITYTYRTVSIQDCLYPLKGPTLNFFIQVGEDVRVPIHHVPTILPWGYPMDMTLPHCNNLMGLVNICQFQSTCWVSSAMNNLHSIFNFTQIHPIWCSWQFSEMGKAKIYYLHWTKIKTKPARISLY